MLNQEAMQVASSSINLISMARLCHSSDVTVVLDLRFLVLSAFLYNIDLWKN